MDARPPPGYVIKNWRTTIDRIAKVISKTDYNKVNLISKLYPETLPVSKLEHFAAPGRIKHEEAINGTYSDAKIGDLFGPTWSTHWFRISISLPASWLGQHVQLFWDSNSEAMIWKDGQTRQGFNHDHGRDYCTISTDLQESERVQVFYVEMACNLLLGAGGGGMIRPPDPNQYYKLEKCEIRTVDNLVYALVLDFDTISDIAKALGEDTNLGNRALQVGNKMTNLLDVNDRDTYHAARELAKDFFSKTNGMTSHNVVAVGNCHIDSGWLWEYEETKRKCARSWSTSIRLLESFEDFKFAASQAQQFEWVNENYPALYLEMQKFSRDGRFYPVGGTWVEMDGNLPSGEGFIRQFLVGQRYFEQHFGSRCTEFWLPDTFGYSPQLPQIMKQAGIDYFVTQKISWNSVNKFPHSTFHWVGIDGSSVLSHFPPADSYRLTGTATEIQKTFTNFRDKGRSNSTLFLYGYGDGGQGPDPEMLERLLRQQDIDGLPKVKLSTPDVFFRDVEAQGTDNLAKWKGELYLEFHNGTYTTQAKIKKNNRMTEFLLGQVEFVATVADVLNENYKYPASELLRLWKLVLCNQFHDILPGTSIEIAHDAAMRYYDDVKKTGATLMDSARDALFEAMNDTSPVAIDVVLNFTSWDRTNVVTIPPASATISKEARAQALEQIDKDGNTLVLASCSSMGWSKLHGLQDVANPATIKQNGNNTFVLDNGLVRAVLDSYGRVTDMFVNGGSKNAIAPNEFGNQLLIFEDRPMYWDAWDIADYHLETAQKVLKLIKPARIVEQGPLRVSLEVVMAVGNSKITQQIILDARAKYVTFDTQVDWQESHKCLKVEFPINASSQRATYECQYGFLERPTHMNTSWDWAKYEVFGHKWADYSEHDWGMAILNDCKYGWSCLENRLRLSLLRSPKNPDANSDMGLQTFKYCAFPHDGTFQSAGVVQAAWELNVPLQYSSQSVSASVPDSASYVQVDTPSVIVGAVKKCEDDVYSFVIRLYEAFGGHSNATVTINNLPNGVLSAQVVNILEDLQGSPLTVTNNSFTLTFTPHQIQSVKVTFFSPAKTAKAK